MELNIIVVVLVAFLGEKAGVWVNASLHKDSNCLCPSDVPSQTPPVTYCGKNINSPDCFRNGLYSCPTSAEPAKRLELCYNSPCYSVIVNGKQIHASCKSYDTYVKGNHTEGKGCEECIISIGADQLKEGEAFDWKYFGETHMVLVGEGEVELRKMKRDGDAKSEKFVEA